MKNQIIKNLFILCVTHQGMELCFHESVPQPINAPDTKETSHTQETDPVEQREREREALKAPSLINPELPPELMPKEIESAQLQPADSN